jgi:hypothetical protein
MRPVLVAFVVALSSLNLVAQVNAQECPGCSRTGSLGYAQPAGGSPIIQGQGTILPYSYWVSAPNPARIYVEYGTADQFPFYGRPYGNPGDRWSWYYMGGGSSRYLARYYYPLLR